MFVDPAGVTRYRCGFRTTLGLESMVEYFQGLEGFEWFRIDRQGDELQVSGARGGDLLLDVWSETERRTWRSRRAEPGERLFGLSIAMLSSGGAETYFDWRAKVLEALQGSLVVTSVLQEIEATHAAGLTILVLDGQELTWLPDEIRMLSHVTCLSVADNWLRVLPDALTELRGLTELDVSQNLLEELPVEIGRLNQLENLSVSRNRLRELPASVGQLTSLRELRANHNQLRKLPEEIGQMTKLRRLHIQQNRLTELPEGFARLTSLQEWDVTQKRLPSAQATGLKAGQNPWVYPPEAVVTRGAGAIREFLATQSRPVVHAAVYTAYVDDNRHPYEEDWKRRTLGTFTQFEEAIAACKKVVDDFFANFPAAPIQGLRGEDAEDLLEVYQRYAEDPWILCEDEGKEFDAWKYAKERCLEIAQGTSEARTSGAYTVYVFDRYMESPQRYKLGEFANCMLAITACREIVDEFFGQHASGTPEELYAAYRAGGRVPVIVSSRGSCGFSAWDYALQLCRAIAAGSMAE